MPRPCSVCSHLRRKDIDEALLSGESFRIVSKRFSLSASALFRHKEHMAERPVEDKPKDKPINGTRGEAARARERVFAHEYATDLNGSRAAVVAGFSPKTADVTASQLLKRPQVKEEITNLLEKRLERAGITAENVLKELGRVGFSNMQDYIQVQPDGSAHVDLSNLTRELASPISEVQSEVFTAGRGENVREIKRTKFKLASKLTALEMLARYFKLIGSDKGGGDTNVGIAVTVETLGAEKD